MVRNSKRLLSVSLLVVLSFYLLIGFNGLVAESEGIKENHATPTSNEEIRAMGETGVIVVDSPIYDINEVLLFEKEGVSVTLHHDVIGPDDEEEWYIEIINQNPINKKSRFQLDTILFDDIFIDGLDFPVNTGDASLLSGESSRIYLVIYEESVFSEAMSRIAAGLDNLALAEMTIRFSVQIGSKEEFVTYTRKLRTASHEEDPLNALYGDPIGEYGYGGDLIYTVYRIKDPQFNVFAIANQSDRLLSALKRTTSLPCYWYVNGEQYTSPRFGSFTLVIPSKATGLVKFADADTVYKNMELPDGTPLHLELSIPVPGMEIHGKTIKLDLGRIDQAGKEEQPVSDSRIDDADVQIILSAENDATELTAGERLQFTAAFANPDSIEKTERNFIFEWSVVDEKTGEKSENVYIDERGRLGASDQIKEEIVHVEVRAFSRIFGTSASRHLTIYPKLKVMNADPASLEFYAGDDSSETVKIQIVPDCLPLSRITWAMREEGIVELTDLGNGTALVKPLKAGRTRVVATEWRGRRVEIPVHVLIPVEKVELKLVGKALPGKSISIHKTCIPINADNKNVEWYLDVDEGIATVKNGVVQISEDAPVGTAITVTCVAIGAKEPVESRIQFVVEE